MHRAGIHIVDYTPGSELSVIPMGNSVNVKLYLLCQDPAITMKELFILKIYPQSLKSATLCGSLSTCFPHTEVVQTQSSRDPSTRISVLPGRQPFTWNPTFLSQQVPRLGGQKTRLDSGLGGISYYYY